jgi:hypothetical protein
MATNGHTTMHQPVEDASTAIHVSQSTSVSRETQYNPDTDIDYLLGLLRNQRATGQLVVDISQGSKCNVRFVEKQKI